MSGTAFGAGEAVVIYWDAAGSTPLATPTTTADGSFSVTLTVPQARAGMHTLHAAVRATGASATIAVQVTPAVYLSPTSGKAGTPVFLVGVGFGAGETVAALWYPGVRLLGQARSNGVGTVVLPFTAPTSALGMEYVIGYGLTTHLYAISPFGVAALSHGAVAHNARAGVHAVQGSGRYVTVTWTGARFICRPAPGTRTRARCVTTRIKRQARLALTPTRMRLRLPAGVTPQRLLSRAQDVPKMITTTAATTYGRLFQRG